MAFTEDQLIGWKKEHWQVFYSQIADQEFIYRPLARGEYRFIQAAFTDDAAVEDYVCKICLLYPEHYDLDRSPAYLVATLAGQIVDCSGIIDPPADKLLALLEKYGEEMGNLANQMACIIVEAFPQYRLEEVESWPLDKMAWYLSRAQYTINELRGGLEQVVEQYGQPVLVRQPLQFGYLDQPLAGSGYEPAAAPQSRAPAALPEIPDFDYGLFDKDEMLRRQRVQMGSDTTNADFPELAEIQKFLAKK
jgi:hypothetical protein